MAPAAGAEQLKKERRMTGIERLHEIMVRLRDPETGCPWDREQTLESLKPCVLEETYELLAAMDRPSDKANHIEELGDVLLQVMFQSVMAEQEGRFSFDDVANAISDKLVRRHPHVFGSVDAKDAATVLRNWEQIKQTEHKKETRHSALDGVPPSLPGLLKAQRTQEKAARVGFDWKDASGPLAKIDEELAELKEEIAARASDRPADSDRVKAELGDLLFAVANLARHLKVDSESALEGTTARFSSRFRAVEAGAKAQGRALKDLTLAEMDVLWDAAKRAESGGALQ
jgi:MazG family protein